MGNHKFRLSDMMPNAWFYKLKDMSKRTTSTTNSSTATAAAHYSNHHHHNKKKQQSTTTNPQKPRQAASSRKSYYFTRDSTPIDSLSHSKSSSIDSLFPDPIITKPRSDFAPPPSPSMEMRSDRALPTESFEEKVPWSSSCNYEPRNIVIDIDGTKQLAAKIENSDDFVTIFDLELRPILTKPRKLKLVKHQQEKNPEFQTVSNKIRTSSSPGGVKLRVNSPRISSKRFTTVNGARRSMTSSSSSSSSSKNKNKKKNAIAESLAIVKRSVNPQEDFKQSMVEMIVEHQIRSTNDLEELLACYLSLNSDEYHDIIISVFKQIWFQLCGLNKNNNGAN